MRQANRMIRGLVSVIALTFMLGLGEAAHAQKGPLFPGEMYEFAGDLVQAVGDLNNDGVLDLVAQDIHHGFYFLSVQLGSTHGDLGPSHGVYPSFNNYTGLAIGRFDSDPFPDLAVAESQSLGAASLQIWRGDGTGNFTFVSKVSVALTRTDFKAADFNHDGIDDLVMLDYTVDTVSILLGGSNGVFGHEAVFPIGLNPTDYCIDDLDGDGNLDLTIANRLSNVTTLTLMKGHGVGGAGAFTFMQSIQLEGSYFYIGLAVGMINNDAIPDIAVAHGNLTVLLGIGDGLFAPPTDLTDYVFGLASGVAIGDLNGDGIADLASTDIRRTRFIVRFGKGDGAFLFPTPVAVGLFPLKPRIADFNNDAIQDIVLLHSDFNQSHLDARISIIIGVGGGEFQERKVLSPHLFGSGTIVTGDLNGDAIEDLVVGMNELVQGPCITVFSGLGNCEFAAALSFPLLANTVKPVRMVVVDFNNDTIPDLFVGPGDHLFQQVCQVLLGLGHGDFGAPIAVPLSQGVCDFAIGDLNGDNILDLVSTSVNAAFVHVGLGDGSFALSHTISLDIPYCPSVAIGDLDGDSHADLLFASHEMRAYKGVGDGTFVKYDGADMMLDKTLNFSFIIPRIGDLDSDGTPDLALYLAGQGPILTLRGTGDGSFEAPSTIYTHRYTTNDFIMRDINGDGHLDLALANRDVFDSNLSPASTVSVHLGAGDGSFEAQRFYVVDSQPTSLALGDMDGDGAIDIITNSYRFILTMLLQNAIAPPPEICLGDADGNGVVNFGDVTAVISNWGATCSAVCPGDANGDHAVDSGDITEILSNWLSACP